jgi:hypothetical protein
MKLEGTHYYQHMCEGILDLRYYMKLEGTHFCQKSEGPDDYQ